VSMSQRDQIRHWRTRALVAEASNESAAAFVEAERQRAAAAVEAVTRTVEAAAGMRAALMEISGRRWISRGARRRIADALAGTLGATMAAELKQSKGRELALAHFADAVDLWLADGGELEDLRARLGDLRAALGMADPDKPEGEGSPEAVAPGGDRDE
jgi:hypothetical protein